MISVLIVDDSATSREFVKKALAGDSQIRVVGMAGDGTAAVEAAIRLRPDVVTMDVNLPGLNGFDATRQIMERSPCPIVIVTATSDRSDVSMSFRAAEAGAVAWVAKPKGLSDAADVAAELVRTVKLMSAVRVVKRFNRDAAHREHPGIEHHGTLAGRRLDIVAVGASTGGPAVLHELLRRARADLPVPLVVVQHMADGFVEGFVEWLRTGSGIPVELVADGTIVRPGRAYVAPARFHCEVHPGLVAKLAPPARNELHVPSVGRLFASIAKSFGPRAVGVLLTGMGTDGARELKGMREHGAVTIAQDRDTSIIFGMPGEAVRLDAASYVLAPEAIAKMLGTIGH